MTEAAVSDWQKGGRRYAKLTTVVPEFLAPDTVRRFFVAVRGGGGFFRVFNPFTPLQREYVVAVTNQKVVVLWLRRPGVFRASIGGVVYETPVSDADVLWHDGTLTVAGVDYEPIAFHQEDAEVLCRLLTNAS